MSDNEYSVETVIDYESQGFVMIPVEIKSKYKTVDFLGFGDYLAISSNRTIAVQSTAYGEHERRKMKVCGEWKAYMWLVGSEQSHEIHVISWRLHWVNEIYTKQRRLEQIFLNDFKPEAVARAQKEIAKVRGEYVF